MGVESHLRKQSFPGGPEGPRPGGLSRAHQRGLRIGRSIGDFRLLRLVVGSNPIRSARTRAAEPSLMCKEVANMTDKEHDALLRKAMLHIERAKQLIALAQEMRKPKLRVVK